MTALASRSSRLECTSSTTKMEMAATTATNTPTATIVSATITTNTIILLVLLVRLNYRDEGYLYLSENVSPRAKERNHQFEPVSEIIPNQAMMRCWE